MENQQQNEELKKQAEIEKEERMRAEARAKVEEEIKARKKKEERKKGEIVLLIILGIIFIVVLVSLGGEKKSTSTQSIVNYEIVEKWEIPNGGKGERIIIPAEFQDKANLKLICDKIENDVKNDRNANVFGFRDMASFQLDKSGSLEDNEGFILNFGKNANTGYHKCAVYYGDHTAETEIIEY